MQIMHRIFPIQNLQQSQITTQASSKISINLGQEMQNTIDTTQKLKLILKNTSTSIQNFLKSQSLQDRLSFILDNEKSNMLQYFNKIAGFIDRGKAQILATVSMVIQKIKQLNKVIKDQCPNIHILSNDQIVRFPSELLALFKERKYYQDGQSQITRLLVQVDELTKIIVNFRDQLFNKLYKDIVKVRGPINNESFQLIQQLKQEIIDISEFVYKFITEYEKIIQEFTLNKKYSGKQYLCTVIQQGKKMGGKIAQIVNQSQKECYHLNKQLTKKFEQMNELSEGDTQQIQKVSDEIKKLQRLYAKFSMQIQTLIFFRKNIQSIVVKLQTQNLKILRYKDRLTKTFVNITEFHTTINKKKKLNPQQQQKYRQILWDIQQTVRDIQYSYFDYISENQLFKPLSNEQINKMNTKLQEINQLQSLKYTCKLETTKLIQITTVKCQAIFQKQSSEFYQQLKNACKQTLFSISELIYQSKKVLKIYEKKYDKIMDKDIERIQKFISNMEQEEKEKNQINQTKKFVSGSIEKLMKKCSKEIKTRIQSSRLQRLRNLTKNKTPRNVMRPRTQIP